MAPPTVPASPAAAGKPPASSRLSPRGLTDDSPAGGAGIDVEDSVSNVGTDLSAGTAAGPGADGKRDAMQFQWAPSSCLQPLQNQR
eukprot:8486572-Pyramimonas_sp.AAC.1